MIVGQSGLGENILYEVDIALEKHELIKVKIVADKSDRQQIAASICDQSGAELIHQIGHMSIFFRASKDNPKIVLPKG